MLLTVFLAAASATTLDRITVTGRSEQSARTRPEAVTALQADEIAAIGATHSNELFSRAPGVWMSRGSGQEQLVALRSPVLTGAGACGAFLMLEDGVSIRPAGFCNVNQAFELNTEQAGSVEVLRGPGSAVHGSNALHGVIDVRAREPQAAPQLGASLETGRSDYYRTLLTYAGNSESIGWRIDGNGVNAGSFRENEGFDQQKLTAQLAFLQAPGAPRLMFAANNLNQETAGFITGRDAYRDARRRLNENPEAFRDARAFRLQARWVFDLYDDKSLLVRPYARHDETRFLQHFIAGKPLEENDTDSAGIQLMFSRDGDQTNWRLGLDAEQADGTVQQTQARPLTTSTPFQNAVRPVGKHYDYQVNATQLGLFAEWGTALSERQRILLGARAEQMRYRYDNRMRDGNTRDDGSLCGFGGCLYNRPADRSDDFSGQSLQLGWTFDASENWQWRTRAARAFRFPQASELYRLQRGQSVLDFDPETLTSLEAGVGYRNTALSASLTAYAMKKRDVILRDADGFGIPDAATTHRGIELDGQWQLASDWTLAGNVSYAIQRYDFSRSLGGGEVIVRDNEVDTAPRTLGSARVQYRLPNDSDLELEWNHTGGYFLDAGNTERYSGHDLLNLRWQQPLAAGLSLALRVMNVTDRRYAERADLGFGQLRYFPGAGRSLFATLDWQK